MKSSKFLAVAALTLAACSRQEAPAPEVAPPPAAPPPVAADVPAGAYSLDKAHASLTFRVLHMGFSNYTAQFKSFDAQLQFDPKNMTASSVTVTIDPKSMDLNAPPAGFLEELTGEMFLDAKKYPEMTYKSTKVESIAANKVRITGDFSMHGVTKPVTLEATFNGGYAGHPMDPHARIGFTATGVLKRGDFGIAYGIPAPGSTMGVSDEVQIAVDAEFSGPPLAMPAAAEPEKK